MTYFNGLNRQDLIVSAFPEYVCCKAGSEYIVWGKILPHTLIKAFINYYINKIKNLKIKKLNSLKE